MNSSPQFLVTKLPLLRKLFKELPYLWMLEHAEFNQPSPCSNRGDSALIIVSPLAQPVNTTLVEYGEETARKLRRKKPFDFAREAKALFPNPPVNRDRTCSEINCVRTFCVAEYIGPELATSHVEVIQMEPDVAPSFVAGIPAGHECMVLKPLRAIETNVRAVWLQKWGRHSVLRGVTTFSLGYLERLMPEAYPIIHREFIK